MTMAVHAYVRPSPTEQRESIRTQHDIIVRYCGGNRLGEPSWYGDTHASGKLSLRDREAGGHLLRNIQRGDHVVIVALDRIFRRLADGVAIFDQFDRLGV